MDSNAFEARMHSGFGLCKPSSLTNEFMASNAFESKNSFWIHGFECIRIQEFVLDSWLRMHSNPRIHFGFMASNAFEFMNSFVRLEGGLQRLKPECILAQVPSPILFVNKLAQRCGIWQIKPLALLEQKPLPVKSNNFGFWTFWTLKLTNFETRFWTRGHVPRGF